jgi:hypothetical protein
MRAPRQPVFDNRGFAGGVIVHDAGGIETRATGPFRNGVCHNAREVPGWKHKSCRARGQNGLDVHCLGFNKRRPALSAPSLCAITNEKREALLVNIRRGSYAP